MSATPGSAGVPVPDVIPVIILNWNGDADTVACLRSFRQSDRAGFVPVLVDNGSEPASVARLKQACGELFRRVLVLDASAVPEGPGISRDALAEYLGDDALVFITVDGPWDVNWVNGPPTKADLGQRPPTN